MPIELVTQFLGLVKKSPLKDFRLAFVLAFSLQNGRLIVAQKVSTYGVSRAHSQSCAHEFLPFVSPMPLDGVAVGLKFRVQDSSCILISKKAASVARHGET